MSALPFSELRKIGSTVYLSGELGFDEDGKIHGDIAQQTERTLLNIEATLASIGLTRRDIVSCTCFLVHKDDFAGFNGAYRAFFTDEPLPVRATVLCDLVLDARIEISVIAHDSRN